MYNAYGSNVFKKYQVNMGNPYQVKPRKPQTVTHGHQMNETKADEKSKSDEILEKAMHEAEQIIAKAKNQADDMLKIADEQIAVHMKTVEQKAKEEGYRKGEKLAQQHYQSLLDEAENLKHEALETYENTVLSLEGEIVQTILDISRKVIGSELSQNRDVIVGLVKNSLLGSSPSGEIIVTVCPDDYDIVLDNKDRLMEGMKQIRDISVKKDSSLQKGGCIVETGFGSVDSSIETQLKELEDTFNELLGK